MRKNYRDRGPLERASHEEWVDFDLCHEISFLPVVLFTYHVQPMVKKTDANETAPGTEDFVLEQ